MEEVNQKRYFAKKNLRKIVERPIEAFEEEEEVEEVKEVSVKYKTDIIICKGEELKKMKEITDNIYDVFLDLDGYKMTLPIKKINGLCCDPIISIQKDTYQSDTFNIDFKIESDKLFKKWDDGEYRKKNYYFEHFGFIHEDEFDKDTHILHILIIIKYLLSNLQYCYGSNRLTLTTNDNLELFTSVFENPNIEMCCDKCCVCLTTTTNKTSCNHSLCFICWEQIKIQTHEDEDEDDEIPCPICRKDIQHID
jgi:hypothetical protein